ARRAPAKAAAALRAELGRSGSRCLSAATARRPAAPPRRARASSTANSPPTSGPSRRDRQSPPDGMGLSQATAESRFPARAARALQTRSLFGFGSKYLDRAGPGPFS